VKKSGHEQGECLRVIVAADGFGFDAEALESEPDGLFDLGGTIDIQSDNGFAGHFVEHEHGCKVLNKPGTDMASDRRFDGIAGDDGGAQAGFEFVDELSSDFFHEAAGESSIFDKAIGQQAMQGLLQFGHAIRGAEHISHHVVDEGDQGSGGFFERAEHFSLFA
jgi:hypothetical protein